MASATIDISVNYTPAPGQPNASPARAQDNIGDTQKGKLSGMGDKSGARTDKTVTVTGGTDRTEQNQPVPEGATFKDATITMTLTCGADKLNLGPSTGNVSVSGRVDGDCIEITTIRREKVGAGEKIDTEIRRMCCPKKRSEKPIEGQTGAIPVEKRPKKLRR
jgi:hypothetical protein